MVQNREFLQALLEKKDAFTPEAIDFIAKLQSDRSWLGWEVTDESIDYLAEVFADNTLASLEPLADNKALYGESLRKAREFLDYLSVLSIRFGAPTELKEAREILTRDRKAIKAIKWCYGWIGTILRFLPAQSWVRRICYGCGYRETDG